MISVVIETKDCEHALARTLAALVPAAAQGVVREVLVADAGSGDGTRVVADAAGCTIVEGGRARALALAKADWVLLLTPGVRLETDWFHEAARFMEHVRRQNGRSHKAASFRRAVDDYGLRARLAEAWAALSARLRPSGAILARREELLAGSRLRVRWLRSRAFVGGLTPD
jgi:glycosyltransferase involved in cell wall biosynthesis